MKFTESMEENETNQTNQTNQTNETNETNAKNEKIDKKQIKHLYLKLFLHMLKINAFTFGGGFVIVSLIRRQFVDKFKWLDETEMLDLTALAQSSPGAIAVNSSMLVGYRIGGIRGAALSTLAAITPPMIILTTISFFYAAFRDSGTVRLVLLAMQAAIAAVVVDVVITMATQVFKLKKPVGIVIMPVAFLIVYFLKINVVWVILAGAITGIIDTFITLRKNKKRENENEENI